MMRAPVVKELLGVVAGSPSFSLFSSNDSSRQASGNQVKQNANEIGASFETRIHRNNTGFVDYECSILATNRAYDNDAEDLFTQGFFILEVAVQQTVYVTAEAELDVGNVTSIVETGFNRGDGGRVKFRSLLTADPAFATIVNVEVLDGALSAPQAAPSATPSFAPSRSPSALPSLVPSATPSIAPSHAPTAVASFAPTLMPSSQPSEPANVPNQSPSAEDDDSGFDRQPLILGAIAGGVATIIVSCFFIFCVWYPFCWRKDNTHQEEATGQRRRRPSISSHSSSESTKAAKAMIPGVLTLDDDARSLANTTVTLGTTQTPSTGIYNRAKMSAWKKRTAAVEPVSMLDSFDESSVYTSIFASAGPSLGQMQGSNTTTTALQSTAAVHDIVMETSNETDSATDLFDLGARDDEHDGKEASSDSDSDPFQLKEHEEKKVEGKAAYDSDSDPFVMEHFHEKNEEKSAELSAANVGVVTKGFDPYDGDSSIGFSSSIAISDSSFGPPMNESEGKTSLSSTSTKTKRIENLVPERKSASRDDTSGIWELERREAKEDSDDEEVLSSSSVVADSAVTLPSSSIASAANNKLLRSILEDARRMANRQSPSSRSRASGKSAPSRLSTKKATGASNGRQSLPLLSDILADNIELKDDEDPSRSPSRSVGALPRSTLGSPEKPTKFALRRKYLDTDSMLSEGDQLFDKVVKNGRPPLPSPTGKLGIALDDAALVTPSSSDLSSNRGRETLGALPMEPRWEKSAEDDDLIIPTSSPGMLGGLSSPWRFDTESPLGARPRTPSSRSGWSTGSQSSGGSGSSKHIGKSGSDLIHREQPIDPDGQLSSAGAVAAVKSGTLDEYKAASEEISPRSRDNNLMRLERHLIDDLQGGFHAVASESSGSGSTDGASRSTTRSSLVTVDYADTKRVIVVAPPGRLGVTLANHHDGNGIVISAVRPYSSMRGKLSPGDKLVAVDDEDVSNMVVSKITSIMASRASQERRLTLITSATPSTNLQETKQEGSP